MKQYFLKRHALVYVSSVVLLSACGGNENPSVPGTAPAPKSFDTVSFLSNNHLKAAEFSSVADNDSIVIKATAVYFPHLTLGNHSKLIIDSSIKACTIIIDNATIGADAQIVMDGYNGNNAPPQRDPVNGGWWQAGQGQDGLKGPDGISGGNGTPASNLNLQMGISSLQTLAIHSNGGNGGNGSDGIRGQIGGNPGGGLGGVFGHSGNGGSGGRGGSGGAGGNGGVIILQLWPAVTTINMPSVAQGITLLAAKGRGGIGGKGGPAGIHGKGGHDGPVGAPGGQGKDGVDGSTKLDIIAPPVRS